IFMSGTTSLGSASLVSGVARLTTANLLIGSNSITAAYQGDSNFGGSTSPATTVNVTQATTTTAVTAPPNPGGPTQLVTLTATITTPSTSSVKPTGQVQFFNGSISLGTAAITNGVATLNTAALTLGNNSITAQYLGDSNYSGSTSPAFIEKINQASTTTVTA